MLKKSASFVLATLKRLVVRPWEKSLSRQARGGRVKCIRFALRNCRLTASPASANVTLIILRVADLAAAALDGHFEHPAEFFSCFHTIELLLFKGLAEFNLKP